MAAPGSLYPEGAQLVESGAASDRAIGQQNVEREKNATGAAESAGAELGANARTLSTQQAQKKLTQMDIDARLRGEMVHVTPQLALGLVKNTGDKSWLQAVGQDMRADVYTALYTHGMAIQNSKKTPRPVTRYLNGKQQNGIAWMDENGAQQEWFGEGIAPSTLHPKAGGKGGSGGAGGDPTFKNNKEFLRQYDIRRKEYEDPIRAKEMQKTNPDKYDQDQQWLKDNQDRYDTITRSMGNTGPVNLSAPKGGESEDSSAPFDADAFIKDALGNQ